MNQTCKKRLSRLKTIVSLHEEKKELLAQIASMRTWVGEVEHIFDGSWATQAEEISNAEVGRRFDAYLQRLSRFVDAPERTEDEQSRLGHLLKVLTHLRPGLVHCYDVKGFPRTNNEMERTIRAIKMPYRRISGRKNWNNYLLRYGRCVAYQEWWLHQPDGEAQLQARLHQVPSASWRHPLTRDSSLPSGAAQPLSFSSSTTGLSCFLRETVGANHQYGRIAPIV